MGGPDCISPFVVLLSRYCEHLKGGGFKMLTKLINGFDRKRSPDGR